MLTFTEFRITDRRNRQIYRRTQLLGLLPLTVILLLFVATARGNRPSIWTVLGIVAGAQLVLAGSYQLHTTRDRLSPLGRRLAATLNRWFPFALFAVQNICVVASLVVLWVGVQLLGLHVPGWQNAIFVVLAVIIPVRRILGEAWEQSGRPLLATASSFLSYLIAMLVALFVAVTLTALLFANRAESAEAVPAPVLLIWVPALLVMLLSLLGLVQVILRARPR